VASIRGIYALLDLSSKVVEPLFFTWRKRSVSEVIGYAGSGMAGKHAVASLRWSWVSGFCHRSSVAI